MSPAELRLLAEELARSAGTLAVQARRSIGNCAVPHTTKSSATDPVTEFDKAAERVIVSELRARRPDDSIVGEEGTGHAGSSPLAWHIDPIDGTVNFVYGLTPWATSIGVLDGDGGLAGAVYAPATDEMFSAARGEGATLNGVPISCSGVEDLAVALVATGFGYDRDRRARQGAQVAALVPLVRDIRRFGSAALDLCMVAVGRVDAYYEEHLNSWDLAAGALIAAEAGATVTDYAGRPARPSQVLATAPGIHAALSALLTTPP